MNDIFDIEVPDVLRDYSGFDADAFSSTTKSFTDLFGGLGSIIAQRKNTKVQQEAQRRSAAEQQKQREHELALANLAANQASQNRAAQLAALRAGAGSSNAWIPVSIIGGLIVITITGVILHKKGVI